MSFGTESRSPQLKAQSLEKQSAMASINLIEAFQEFKDAENIDRPTMMKVVEDVFKTLLRKKYGSDDNFDVIVNAEKGDLGNYSSPYDRGRWTGGRSTGADCLFRCY